MLSDLLLAVDSGDYAALVLLDLSAAFDTVDHAILLKRLQTSFGLNGPVLNCSVHIFPVGRSAFVVARRDRCHHNSNAAFLRGLS